MSFGTHTITESEMRAIVVDDSRTTRRILGKMLEEIGFTVSGAEDGRDALTVLEAEGAPDLMLVDWNMPNMDGYELVCAIREEPKYESIKLVMVTTETGLDRVTAALEAGASEYVMKPFTKDTITDKLRMIGIELAD